jgi:hypothetical protein
VAKIRRYDIFDLWLCSTTSLTVHVTDEFEQRHSQPLIQICLKKLAGMMILQSPVWRWAKLPVQDGKAGMLVEHTSRRGRLHSSEMTGSVPCLADKSTLIFSLARLYNGSKEASLVRVKQTCLWLRSGQHGVRLVC